MPLDPNAFQQWQQGYQAQQAADEKLAQADFGVPKPKTQEQQLNAMPNADKLTKIERGIYGALPGITTWMDNNKLMGRSVSEQLDKFNSSWAGKALNSLDVLAEGLERGVGLVSQMVNDPDFDMSELQSAWYAGSLTYDTTNLPTFKRGADGQIIGMQIPTDLPGSGGLSAARVKIQSLIDQGMDPKEALASARDDYYNGLGALALRAQLNDVYGHVLGDPLNFLTAYLKPVQALKARRFAALSTKLTGGVEDFVTGAAKASDLLKTASNAEDALKYADEAFQFAQLAGDTKSAAKYGEQAAELAKGLGKAEDVGRYSGEAARLAGMSVEEASKFSDDALRAIGKKQLNSLDKFAIMMTGGDPFRPSALGTKFANTPVIGKVAKLFQLTPESKAKELLTLVGDNMGATIARMMSSPTAEADFVSYMRRVSKGATGIEYGHGMMTLEGRTVQAFVKGSEADIERMFQQFQELAPTRSRLQFLSESLGESPEKLMRLMDENPEAVLKMLAKNAQMNPTMAAMLQTGELTPDALKAISKTIGDMPYNKEMFFAKALDAIETTAMRQSVVQFGIKSKGLMTRWSDAIKSAESLAFLKLNPGYPIRNKINNDVTMLARGLFGHVDDGAIETFWKEFGVKPKRLGNAELAQDIAGTKTASKMSQADRILADALKGGNYGVPEKAKEFFSNINLGKADFAGYWGQKMETSASRKAFTLGTQQFLRRYFKPKPAREYINPRVMDEIGKLSPDFERELNNAIRASGAMEGKFDNLLNTNLNLNVDSVLDDVTESLGTDVRAMIGDEILEVIHKGLPDAIANGKVDSFVQATKAKLNAHIEDLFQKQIDNVVEHVKAQSAAGGPNVWNQKLGEAQDLFWGAHIEYSMRMPEATRLAREASSAGDFSAARSLWAKEAEDGRQFYDRAFRRVDAYIEGLEQGTAHLAAQGVKLPFAPTKRTFTQWKGMWQDFHQTKNKLIEDFFEGVKAKKPVKFDDVQKQLDTMYQDAISKEDSFMQQLDDNIAGMIDDPQIKTAYMNARDQLAELRRADKTNVANIRKEIADLPKEQRQPRWNAFWQERATKYQEMRSVDAAASAIQQGDPNALAMFEGAGETTRTAERKLVSLEKATGVPRSELPPEVSARFEQEARRMMDELSSGTGPQVSRPKQGVDGETVNIPSTNADWYRELPKNLQNKKTLNAALEKIIKDKGSDKGVNVERLKEMMIDRFRYGTPETGTPPDLNVLQQLGADDTILQGALDEFNDITKMNLSLDEALAKSKGVDFEEGLTDASRPFYDDAGNLVTPKKAPQGIQPNFIADVNKVIPNPQPIDFSLDLMAYGRQHGALDEIVNGAKRAAKKQSTLLSDLPANLQDEVRKSIKNIKNDFADTRYQAMKFGEWQRDSALLNYNRRTNFDNYLGHVAPFAFWSTSSMFQWAVESIDRPAMLTNYLRSKQFLATAGMERDGMASRTKGKIRIDLPFAPDWMGEQFIDPLRLALPFDNWAAPFEQFKKDQEGAAGRTTRVLDQMLAEGTISQDEYDTATTEQSGATWDYAEAQMATNDQSDRYDAWDFSTAMASPHTPIMWAYNAAFGDKEDIGPFSPLSRIARNVATQMGVEDWNNSKYNLEAKVRRQMGLNSYDKWDDYRIKRAAGDLAGGGEITPDEMKEAIAMAAMVESGQVTPEDAKKESEAYKMAVARSNQEYTGGPAAFALGLLGISVTSVPQGENNLRAMQDDFGNAYQKYKDSNDSLTEYLDAHPDMTEEDAAEAWEKANPKLAADGDALTKFFEDNPEYEGRLGLFDNPEEQVKKFYVDQVWKTFNELPKVHQDEAREHLGQEFQDAFMNKETRSYDSIPPETMAVWLKLMGTDPLGGLKADQRLLASLYGKVQYSDPEMAWRVQTFYDKRKTDFPEFYEKQSAYYELADKSQKKTYLKQNPDLQQYFDFRRNFLRDNPDITPYLTDNEKAIEEAKRKTRNPDVAIPTAKEINVNLSPPMQRLLSSYFNDNDELPYEAEQVLEDLADQYNLTPEQLLRIIGGGQP